MKWAEFRALIEGLSADTPLGRIVQIRSERDPEILKKFTPGQMRIHDEWQYRMAGEVSQEQLNQFLAEMQKIFTAWGKSGAENEV